MGTKVSESQHKYLYILVFDNHGTDIQQSCHKHQRFLAPNTVNHVEDISESWHKYDSDACECLWIMPQISDNHNANCGTNIWQSCHKYLWISVIIIN